MPRSTVFFPTWCRALLVLFTGLEAFAGDSFLANARNPRQRVSGANSPQYRAHVVPVLDKYCYACHGNGKHKGDLKLDTYTNEITAAADQKTWERVLKMVSNQEMPPSAKPQPSAAERDLIAKWIERDVFKCDCNHPDPGRVTMRRLNRAEYNNTIRDLVGVEFHPADDFPVDDSGYGFDNIGDALSLPPVLLEKYLAATQKILDAALLADEYSMRRRIRYPVDLLELGYNAKQQGDGMAALNSIEEDDVAVHLEAPWAVEYAVRVKAFARQDTDVPIKLTFLLDKVPVKDVIVATNKESPEIYEAIFKVPPGKHRVRAAVRRVKDGLSERDARKWKNGENQKGAVFAEYLELDGPLQPRAKAGLIARDGKSRPGDRPTLIIPEPKRGKEAEAAKSTLEEFARRAFRRPVSRDESERLLKLVNHAWQQGQTFRDGVRVGFEAILVSPHFLFRSELQPEPDNPKAVYAINEHALASRLSYFLWSSMPDDELFNQARRGTLRKNLETQVRRMLASPKASALTDNFAGQWLQTRSLSVMTPDSGRFHAFDENLRTAMLRETGLFFEWVMRQNRSILDFLTGDYTFVNERLARHYGIDSVKGEEFQRVSLQGKPRRGVLTQASVLTLSSNPTRTSPVKRGKWVLENLLNSPPPPPPPNVPELGESKEKILSGSLRQRMEKHRSDPACASCHERMDPIGFGLENFDGIGAWREKEDKFAIDSTGELLTGETFSNAPELLNILATRKRNEFIRCLADKMLTYALGRGLEYTDKCALDQITAALQRDDYRFSTLVLAIARSTPFQMRRGEGSK